MWEVIPGTVDQWALASSAVAADWYDAERDQANIDGTFRAIVEPLADLGTSALVGWATEPLRQAVPDLAAVKYRTVSGVQKRVTNSANYTITGSSKADPQARGWMRKTSAGACNFCKMVASRGAVFSEKTVRFACHDECTCRAVPAWSGRELPVKPYEPSLRYEGMTDAEAAKERAKLNRSANAWIKANLT